MKLINILFLLSFCSLAYGQEEIHYYSSSYDEPGFKATIKEIERGSNYSILEMEVIESDAQGAFTLFRAAVYIGKQLGKSYFTFISEKKKGKNSYLKIYFTDDTSTDPSKIFPNEMSKQKIKQFKKNGYASVERYDSLFKLMPNK